MLLFMSAVNILDTSMTMSPLTNTPAIIVKPETFTGQEHKKGTHITD